VGNYLAFDNEYAGGRDSVVILIPDTNALLLRPDLEKWRLEDPVGIDMVILPVILSELDYHKVNHRNEDVREKAQTLVRKMKEYRRRGSLHDGVIVVGGRISLRAIAIEPSADRAPSWFDFSSADDRFLAAGLEIISENLATPVYIVTADINMQNKAEFAGIPHLDVDVLVTEGGR
jgi:predicted ribonuclease YlaK